MRPQALVVPLRQPPDRQASSFKAATCLIPHGVGLLTFTSQGRSLACTVSGVMRLGIEPPRLLVSIEKGLGSSRLADRQRFGLSILAGEQSEFADRFAGGRGMALEAGCPDASWCASADALPTVRGAVASFQCEVEDLVERGSCTVLIGQVRDAHTGAAASALVAWRGEYEHLGWSEAEIARATGRTPCR